MRLDLTIQDRQRTRAIDSRQLRQIVIALLSELMGVKAAELGIMLVAAPQMTRLNETFLKHEGSTDVITFDYGDEFRILELYPTVQGEIFVCVDEAVLQSRQFRTTWQSEIVRYVVHGVLHLRGYDDRQAADSRRMKREENRLLRLLASRFPLSGLARKTKLVR